MKKTRMRRVSINFDDLLCKWEEDSRKSGQHVPKVQITDVLAQNMKNFKFKPGKGYFKEGDLW